MSYVVNNDEFLFELCDGIIGDNYPFPDRMLLHIETIVNRYLLKELCGDNNYNTEFDVFAVEGGTAAMCYIFDSLAANRLLNKGDKIALMTPIFTPYLEIPHLPEYDFDVIRIHANELDENNNVKSFSEKSDNHSKRINAGYMVVNKKVLDYLTEESGMFEKDALEKLSQENQVGAYLHEGFWQCMDYQHEREYLENLIKNNEAPWIKWQ